MLSWVRPLAPSVSKESPGREPNQALARAGPYITFAIFEEGVDRVEGHTFSVELRDESAFLKAVDATVSTHPKIAPAVFPKGLHEPTGKPLALSVGSELALVVAGHAIV